MTSALVSVIIRSMDRPTLAEALASIAGQTYPRIEILLVNAKGGRHGDPSDHCGLFPLRIINQGGMPLGRSAAANAGLDAVSGAYFAFLDDDDTLDTDHFARLVVAQQAAGGNLVPYVGVRSQDRHDPTDTVLNVFAERWEEGKLLAGNFIPIHAPLVPSTLLATGVRFDVALDVYEDWDFWLQLSGQARFALLDGVTATYYVAGGSGVNPQSVAAEVMRQATLAIYTKWLPKLDAESLWEVTRLYHTRNRTLHATYEQLESLKQELVQIQEALGIARNDLKNVRNTLDVAHAELASVYNSRSWRITNPLRYLMSLLHRP
jgi:glycosyltransferase involved in cell wall biosynthesis